MYKNHKIKLNLFAVIFLLTVSLFQSCSNEDDGSDQSSDEKTYKFDALTLPGTYDVTFAFEQGVHVYKFDADGSVLIDYADGTLDTESWTVNSSGELVFSGTIEDVFTLTSGDQFSGKLKAIIQDKGGSKENTTGTITLQK